MKKLFLIILILSLAIVAFSQSKSDTNHYHEGVPCDKTDCSTISTDGAVTLPEGFKSTKESAADSKSFDTLTGITIVEPSNPNGNDPEKKTETITDSKTVTKPNNDKKKDDKDDVTSHGGFKTDLDQYTPSVFTPPVLSGYKDGDGTYKGEEYENTVLGVTLPPCPAGQHVWGAQGYESTEPHFMFRICIKCRATEKLVSTYPGFVHNCNKKIGIDMCERCLAQMPTITPVKITSPTNNSEFTLSAVVVKWNKSDEAKEYIVDVIDLTLGESITDNIGKNTTTLTSFALPSKILTKGHKYIVNVGAKDKLGNVAWTTSTPLIFSIKR